jgi:hypothetical protein
MEIAFDTRSLRSLVESARSLTSRFGASSAQSIMMLISDLRAVDSVNELIAVDFSFSSETRKVLTLSTKDGARLIMEPNHLTVPMSTEGQVEWQHVFRVRITGIEGAAP